MSTQQRFPIWAAALAAAALGAPALAAAPAAGRVNTDQTAPQHLLILAARGGGNWRLECDIQTAGGRSYGMKQLGSGVYSTGSIVETDVVDAQCRYFVPENHVLRIALADEAGDFRCPWRSAEDCIVEVEGESRDSFTVSLK